MIEEVKEPTKEDYTEPKIIEQNVLEKEEIKQVWIDYDTEIIELKENVNKISKQSLRTSSWTISVGWVWTTTTIDCWFEPKLIRIQATTISSWWTDRAIYSDWTWSGDNNSTTVLTQYWYTSPNPPNLQSWLYLWASRIIVLFDNATNLVLGWTINSVDNSWFTIKWDNVTAWTYYVYYHVIW